MIRFDSKVLHITATIQISNMGARFLADAASVVESREKELCEQETMNKAMELLPADYGAITSEHFAEMCFASTFIVYSILL